MEEFSCKTCVISGSGAVAALARFRAKRLLLVTDPFFLKNGGAEAVAAAAKAERVAMFSKVAPDPAVSLAAEGTAALKEFGPDLVVALGGGSAMDLAKAMVYFAGAACPLAAVPTTSGSGSEVTDFAILTHRGVKHPLVDGRLRPDMAILDGDFLRELPKKLIAEGGFDVLSHALEAVAATGAGEFTDLLAAEGFRRAYTLLGRSFAGDDAVRLDVHRGACIAGLSFTQAGLGLCHALSHALGGQYHAAHGRLNAVLLPAVLEVNSPAALPKYAALARAAGIPGTADTVAVRNLKNGLLRLRRELELPESLAEMGIQPDRAAVVPAVLADPCCKSNPVPVTEALVRRVLDMVAGHG